MFGKCVSLGLAILLVFSAAPIRSAAALSESEKEIRLAEKVRSGINQLGTGPDARVKLKLKDKSKLAGYISEIADDHFVVTDPDTLKSTRVAYPDVSQVKGNNLTTKTKIIIGVSIAVAVIIVLYIVRGAFCDGC